MIFWMMEVIFIYNNYLLKTRHILRKLDFSDPENKAYSILINNNYSGLVKKLKGNGEN